MLVTESTPFGLHDLKLAVDVVKTLKIPFVREMPEWNEKFLGIFEAIKLQIEGREEART